VSAHTISIALLPFESLSPSASDSWLAVGLVQDLITEIARFPTLRVISGQSSLAANVRALDDASIGQRLGVEYLLKGSIRRMEKALRISVQLVQLEDSRNLSAECYDLREDELFALQDEIVAKVANALSVRIEQSMLSSAKRRPPASLKAYECWLRGLEGLQQGTPESDEQARGFFELALKVDPDYARAHGGLSLSHFNEWSCQAWNLWEEKEKLAYDHALRAEALDPDDHIVQIILGRIEQYPRDFEEIHCTILCGQPGATGRGDTILDDQARQAYRQRLREIDQELAEAERDNDPGRCALIEKERQQLLEELRKATGLGGRERKIGDVTERMRSAVTWRIRDAIKKLGPAHPTLSRHLANSIQTGLFCSYTPEKPATWFV
jgi:TolB-like protein